MKKNNQTITVKVDEENPEPYDVIAKAIIDVSVAFETLNNSKLNRRCILLLLKDITGLGMREIELVLDAAPKLKSHFLKKEPIKK